MRLALSVSRQLKFPKKMKQESSNTLDMFYGFWKYLGVTSVFLIGIALFWWGMHLVIFEYTTLKYSAGYMANILVMPLVFGLALAWLGLTEFLRIIRE